MDRPNFPAGQGYRLGDPILVNPHQQADDEPGMEGIPLNPYLQRARQAAQEAENKAALNQIYQARLRDAAVNLGAIQTQLDNYLKQMKKLQDEDSKMHGPKIYPLSYSIHTICQKISEAVRQLKDKPENNTDFLRLYYHEVLSTTFQTLQDPLNLQNQQRLADITRGLRRDGEGQPITPVPAKHTKVGGSDLKDWLLVLGGVLFIAGWVASAVFCPPVPALAVLVWVVGFPLAALAGAGVGIKAVDIFNAPPRIRLFDQINKFTKELKDSECAGQLLALHTAIVPQGIAR